MVLPCFDIFLESVGILHINWPNRDNFLSDFGGVICSVEQAAGVGIFDKHTFALIGFDSDAVAYRQLAEMIQDNGGLFFAFIFIFTFRCLTANSSQNLQLYPLVLESRWI